MCLTIRDLIKQYAEGLQPETAWRQLAMHYHLDGCKCILDILVLQCECAGCMNTGN